MFLSAIFYYWAAINYKCLNTRSRVQDGCIQLFLPDDGFLFRGLVQTAHGLFNHRRKAD